MELKPTDVTILFVYCWISTCFGPTGPSSGEFVQLFTQPLVPDCTINKHESHNIVVNKTRILLFYCVTFITELTNVVLHGYVYLLYHQEPMVV